MQKDRAFLTRRCHHVLVHLVRRKNARALLCLLLLAHTCPNVSVDHIGVHNCLERVVHDGCCANAFLGDACDQVGIGLIARRACTHKVNRQYTCKLEPRMHDVVAVTHVDHLLALDAAEHFFHRQGISHDLARVVEVCQPVDHRHTRVLCQFEYVSVREQARHHEVVHAAQHARDVLRRLAFADPDLLTKAQRVAAQAKEARLKRDTCAR
mmetsp:Transcript_14614/g.29287  ORF Transcript_14614/g.29287 Transcript_14614/m.29287 type:complete len:210 (+) Transcript_14614:408-1037(+)